MARQAFLYHICPIDYWAGALRFDEAVRYMDIDSMDQAMANIVNAFDLAQIDMRAANIGWEGDICMAGPYVFFVPAENEMSIGFVWKHGSNGGTFVWSPVELPHLKEIASIGWASISGNCITREEI